MHAILHCICHAMAFVDLLINLSEPFSTRPSDRAQIWHACVDRDETGSHQKKLTNPTPEGFRGYLLMFVACLWVGGWFVAWFKPVVDRKLLERPMSPSPKSQVMFASAFSWIGDFFRIFGNSYFSSYGEFGEFSLTFTAALSLCIKQCITLY